MNIIISVSLVYSVYMCNCLIRYSKVFYFGHLDVVFNLYIYIFILG